METYIFTYNYSYVSYENYINSPVLQKGENVICYGKIDEIQNDKVKLSLVYALNTQGPKRIIHIVMLVNILVNIQILKQM